MNYKKIPLEVAEADYERVMNLLRQYIIYDTKLVFSGYGKYRYEFNRNFGVQFRLGKET